MIKTPRALFSSERLNTMANHLCQDRYVFTTLKHKTQLLFCSGLDKQFIRLQWGKYGNLAIQLNIMLFKTYTN